MKVIIDRFEGSFAVVELENKKTVNMPAILIPKGAKEGDVLEITIDKNETEQRRKRINSLIDEVWKN